MRRSIKAYFAWVSGPHCMCSQEGVDKSACTTFALSASDVYHVQTVNVVVLYLTQSVREYEIGLRE